MSDPAEAHPARHDRWFAIRARPLYEFRVRDGLRDAGIIEFLPTSEETTRWSDRQKTLVRPIFPGYLFAFFCPSTAQRVRRIRGVVRILGTPEPIAIDDAEIENLRRVLESRVTAVECPYVAGEAVTIATGPLAGTSGVVRRVRGATRIYVGIEILGRSVSVEIDAADIGQLLNGKRLPKPAVEPAAQP